MGEIITFYSYKGGTGRTMALANVAWLLASNGNRVLMVDWDLEAPGLHRYLSPFLTDRSLENSQGVIDVMVEYAKQAVTPGERPEGWYRKLAAMDRHALGINWTFPPARDAGEREARGYLEFIPAGQQTETYATRVNSFNWDNFYERLGGGQFINEIRDNLRDSYDYVLIDSRTGVSDTSGICTVQLPDKVVVCFTLNNQSIEGASLAARAIQKQHAGGRIPIFPVPTRVDGSETDRLNLRRALARQRFHDFVTFLPSGTTADRYWSEVEVPYLALYAYEELLTPFGEPLGDPKSVLAAFERIAGYITGTDQRLKEIDQAERDRIRREFAGALSPDGHAASAAAPAAPAAVPTPAAADLYFSYHTADLQAVQPIRDRLRSSGLDGLSGPAFETGKWSEEVPARLAASRRFVYFIGPRGLSPWQRRELAFAGDEWKRARAAGRPFQIVPVLLPQAGASDLPTEFLMTHAADFRAGLDSRPAWDSLVRLLREDDRERAETEKNGLAYEEEDAPLLSGRDEDVRRLADLVSGRSRLVRLRGDSGAGKTSLLQAGLIPHLRRQAEPRWEIVSMRPGADPFVALSEAIQPLMRTASTTDRVSNTLQLGTSLAAGTFTVHSVLLIALRENPGARILLIIDDAEELFTLTQEQQRRKFISSLESLPPDLPVTLLLAIRPDWEPAAEAASPRLRDAPAMEISVAGSDRLELEWRKRQKQDGNHLRKETVIDDLYERTLDSARVRRLIALSRLMSGEVKAASLPESALRTLDPFVRNGVIRAKAAPDVCDNALELTATGAALREFARTNAAALAWRAEVLKAIESGTAIPPAASKDWHLLLEPEERQHLQATTSPAAQPVIQPAPVVWNQRRWLYAAAAAIGMMLAAFAFWPREPEARVTLPPPLNERADKAFAERQYDDAVKLYDQWIQIEPSAEAYSKRALSHQALNHLEQAERDFTSALGFDPRNAGLFVQRAAVRADLNKLEEARNDVLEAVKLNPEIAKADEIRRRPVLAKAVESTPRPIEVRRPIVMGQVAFEAQKPQLGAALEELGRRGYRPYTGVEVVGEKAPARSELRYFRPELKEDATVLADILGNLGIEVRPVLVNPDKLGKPPASLDHFEVWLAARKEDPPAEYSPRSPLRGREMVQQGPEGPGHRKY